MGRQSHVPLVFSHGTVLLKAFHRQSELHWRLRIQKGSCRLVPRVKLVYNVRSYWVHCASSSYSWESSTAFLIEILIGDMSRRGVVAKGCTNMRGSLASGDGASAPLPWGCSRSKVSLDPTGWSRYSLCRQMVWGKKTGKSFSTTPDMASLPCTSEAFIPNIYRGHRQAIYCHECWPTSAELPSVCMGRRVHRWHISANNSLTCSCSCSWLPLKAD